MKILWLRKQCVGEKLMPETGKKISELKKPAFVVLAEYFLSLVAWLLMKKIKKEKINETWGQGLHRF